MVFVERVSLHSASGKYCRYKRCRTRATITEEKPFRRCSRSRRNGAVARSTRPGCREAIADELQGAVFGARQGPEIRKRRIETQLAARRVPRFEYWAHWPLIPPTGTELTAEELRLWFDILRVAEPVLPRTYRADFGTFVRLHGLRVEALERDDAVLFVGSVSPCRGTMGNATRDVCERPRRGSRSPRA
jgi:hypothetical protein